MGVRTEKEEIVLAPSRVGISDLPFLWLLEGDRDSGFRGVSTFSPTSGCGCMCRSKPLELDEGEGIFKGERKDRPEKKESSFGLTGD